MARTKPAANEQAAESAAEPVAVPQVSPHRLPPHRSEAIAALTIKHRQLAGELRENHVKVEVLNARNAVIKRELSEISKQVHEHAWDGDPPGFSSAYF